MKIRTQTILFLLVSATTLFAQTKNVTVSGIIKDGNSKNALAFANVVLKTESNNSFVTGTITKDDGRFSIPNIKSGNYTIEVSITGYKTKTQALFIGNLSDFIDVATIEISENTNALEEVTVTSKQNSISNKMDKKTFSVADNVAQSGGSVLQTMQNLPGITIQDGKVQLRGNDKITVLIDGKQTGLTGFGNQSGLDNIPASAIEKIEIINNPSAKYDANGNAGIINIIYKKNKKEGFNGKFGYTNGFGALWVRKENLPTIRKQFQLTPKVKAIIYTPKHSTKTNLPPELTTTEQS
jgi:hypothetical protein